MWSELTVWSVVVHAAGGQLVSDKKTDIVQSHSLPAGLWIKGRTASNGPVSAKPWASWATLFRRQQSEKPESRVWSHSRSKPRHASHIYWLLQRAAFRAVFFSSLALIRACVFNRNHSPAQKKCDEECVLEAERYFSSIGATERPPRPRIREILSYDPRYFPNIRPAAPSPSNQIKEGIIVTKKQALLGPDERTASVSQRLAAAHLKGRGVSADGILSADGKSYRASFLATRGWQIKAKPREGIVLSILHFAFLSRYQVTTWPASLIPIRI